MRNRKLIDLFKKKFVSTREQQIKIQYKIDKFSELEQNQAHYHAEVEMSNKQFREMIMAGV